ncbi:hypothetical protein [Bartonella sp. CL162QHHD]|uniref:hypothetical protein n=1 Tax=Bartonella sp. CL162QHHD TaxID=3243516 RepID=UPI0035D0AA02
MFRRIGTKTGGFGVLLWCVLGESAAMKGLECFFIAVTMVRVMLLFFGKESFEGRFFSRYGKGGMKSLCMRNCGGRVGDNRWFREKRGKPMGGGLFFGVCQFQKPLIKHFGD